VIKHLSVRSGGDVLTFSVIGGWTEVLAFEGLLPRPDGER
jgi:hypothetical protein